MLVGLLLLNFANLVQATTLAIIGSGTAWVQIPAAVLIAMCFGWQVCIVWWWRRTR